MSGPSPVGCCVLGLDPGIGTFGYGFVREGAAPPATFELLECGVITTPSKEPIASRLHTIYLRLCALIEQYHPAEIALEDFMFALNPRTALHVGEAHGVALLACAAAGLPVSEYEPSVVKQFVAGKGNARKQQVGEQVRLILGLPAVPTPDDAADAAAIAICHLLHRQLQRRIGR